MSTRYFKVAGAFQGISGAFIIIIIIIIIITIIITFLYGMKRRVF